VLHRLPNINYDEPEFTTGDREERRKKEVEDLISKYAKKKENDEVRSRELLPDISIILHTHISFQLKIGSEHYSSQSYELPAEPRVSSSHMAPPGPVPAGPPPGRHALPQPEYSTYGQAPLERSTGAYGSRTSLLNIQDAPITSRYLQASSSSSNLSNLGMGSVGDMPNPRSFPLQRVVTADKPLATNNLSRAQKTLSMHGLPSMNVPPPGPARSSMGGSGTSNWWCAPFSTNTGAEPDYLAGRPAEPDYLASRAPPPGLPQQWAVPAPKVCPILDDEDGHLSYKLGDIIENENQRCKFKYAFLAKDYCCAWDPPQPGLCR
jgi:hypothetical protein